MDIDTVRELGYMVQREGPNSYRVRGHGLDTLYSGDDDAAWESLIEGHDDRAEYNALSAEDKEAFLQAPRKEAEVAE